MPQINTAVTPNITGVTAINPSPVLLETATPDTSLTSFSGKAIISYGALGTAITRTAGIDGYMISEVKSGTLYYNAGTTVAPALVAFNSLVVDDTDSVSTGGASVIQIRINGIWSFNTSTNASTKLSGNDSRLFWLPAANANGAVAAFDVRVIEVGIDGTFNGNDLYSQAEGTVIINVAAVNDAPTAAAPSSVAATEQISLNLHGTGISIADIDAGSATMNVTLAVGTGVLTVAAGTTGITIVSGNGTASVEVSGNLTQINNLLAGSAMGTVAYINNSDAPAATDTLNITVNDNGNTGSGGSLTGKAATTINITAVNDAPVLTVPLVAQQLGLTQDVTLTTISVNDPDIGAGTLTVTLDSQSEGTLSLVDSMGVTVGATTATSISFSGTQAAVNTALGKGVNFKGDNGFDGQASLKVTVSDGNLSDIESITINGAPVITSISHSLIGGGYASSSNYNAADELDFTVNFSASVAVTGTPRLVLDVGGDVRYATYVSGGPGTALVFKYTVGTTENDNNGIQITSVDLNSGTLNAVVGGAPAILTPFGAATPSLGAVNVDTTAPITTNLALTLDTGSSSVDGITFNGGITVTNLEAGTTREYTTDAGKTYQTFSGSTFTVSGDGVKTVEVIQTDAAGNVSKAGSLTFTLDTTAPDAVVLALDADTGYVGDSVTTSGKVNVSGLEVGSTATYSVNGGKATAFAGSSFTLTGDGAKVVSVVQTDKAGNVSSQPINLSFEIDTALPLAPAAPTLITDSGSSTADFYTNIANVKVSSASFEALLGTVSQYSLDAGKTWTAFNNTAILDLNGSGDGLKSVTLRQLDGAGNASLSSAALNFTLDTTPPSAPVADLLLTSDSAGASTGDDYTNDNTPDVSFSLAGTGAVAGDLLTIFDGTNTTKVTLAAPDVVAGKYVHTFAKLEDANYSLSATITDLAGNASSSGSVSVTVDTAAPSTPAITLLATSDLGTSDNDRITSDDTPTVRVSFSGVGAGDILNVKVDSVDVVPGGIILSAMDITNGYYDVTTSKLADGGRSFSSTATDKAGNTSLDSPAVIVTVDTTPPAALTNAVDLLVTSDSLYNVPMSLLGTVGANSDNITSDATPTFRVDLTGGGLVASDQVYLYQGSTKVGSATLLAGDITAKYVDITASTLTDGKYVDINAKSADRAGNLSLTGSPDLTVTIDTVVLAPTALALEAASNSGSLMDSITKFTTPAFSVEGEDGAKVYLYSDVDKSGTYSVGDTLLGNATVAAGKASITTSPALTDGKYNVGSLQIDVAGNVSASTPTLALTIDSTAPVVTYGAVAYYDSGLDTLTITGSGFENGMILDASKLSYNDGITTASLTLGTITFQTKNSITILLDSKEAVVLESADFGLTSGADVFSIAAGALADAAGNTVTATATSLQVIMTQNNIAQDIDVYSADLSTFSGDYGFAEWFNEVSETETMDNTAYLDVGDRAIIEGVSAANVELDDFSMFGYITIENPSVTETNMYGSYNANTSINTSSLFGGQATFDNTWLTFADGSMLLKANAAEILTAGAGADQLIGSSAGDTLYGLAGNDKISGNDGHDLIFGGRGNDNIDGGAGNDLLYGGSGIDKFVFSGVSFGHDSISGLSGSNQFDALGGEELVFTDLEDADADLLLANAAQAGADVLIYINANSSIRLLGVTLADLSVDNFTGTQMPMVI